MTTISRRVILITILNIITSRLSQAQQSNATCNTNNSNSFLFNTAGESPWQVIFYRNFDSNVVCFLSSLTTSTVWSKLQSLCIPSQTINVPPLLDPSYGYNPPGGGGNICQCNVVAYNLMAGCSWCQLGNTSNWLTEGAFRKDCPAYNAEGLSFTENVVGIPSFAWRQWQGGRWDPSTAQSAATSLTSTSMVVSSTTLSRSFSSLNPASTANSSPNPPPTPSSQPTSEATPPTSPSSGANQAVSDSQSKVKWGPIIGGTAGGIGAVIIIIIIVIICMRRKEKRNMRNRNDQDDQNGNLQTRSDNPYLVQGAHAHSSDSGSDMSQDKRYSKSRKTRSFLNLFGPSFNDLEKGGGVGDKEEKNRRSKRSELFHDPKSFFSPRPAPDPIPKSSNPKTISNDRQIGNDISPRSSVLSQNTLPPHTGIPSVQYTEGFKSPISQSDRNLVDKVMERQRTQGRLSVGGGGSRSRFNSGSSSIYGAYARDTLQNGNSNNTIGGKIKWRGSEMTITQSDKPGEGIKLRPITKDKNESGSGSGTWGSSYANINKSDNRKSIPMPRPAYPRSNNNNHNNNRETITSSARNSNTYSNQIPSIVLTSLPPTPNGTRSNFIYENSSKDKEKEKDKESRESHAVTLPPPPRTPAHDFSLPPEEYRKHQSTIPTKNGLSIETESTQRDRNQLGKSDIPRNSNFSLGGGDDTLLPSLYNPPSAATRFSPSGRSSFGDGDGNSTIINGYGDYRTSYGSTIGPRMSMSMSEKFSPSSRYTTYTDVGQGMTATGTGIENGPLPPLPTPSGKEKKSGKKGKNKSDEYDNTRQEEGRRSTEGRKKKKKLKSKVKN